jgi:16S rRNA (uracil1498-N3)-methyltransferase
MARRLFIVDEIRRGQAEIRGEAAQHLTRVLRVEPGQQYEISDNSSLYLASVETARKEQVVFRVLDRLEAPAPAPPVTLLAALVKFDHFEWMLEKATELGATRIVPVEAERSEKGLSHAAAKRAERWRRILLEASQQSRRVTMPVLGQTLPLPAALRTEAAHRLFLDEQAGARPILRALGLGESTALLAGPEGGWSERERELALAAGWVPVSLGRNILRAETACAAALAVVAAAAL